MYCRRALLGILSLLTTAFINESTVFIKDLINRIDLVLYIFAITLGAMLGFTLYEINNLRNRCKRLICMFRSFPKVLLAD